jgi:Tol biopolymer transport system component
LGQSARELREGAWGLAVSPDGTRIASIPQPDASGQVRELWVMTSQGDNPQRVLAFGEGEWLNTSSAILWSPDGQRLAYGKVQRTPEKQLSSIETCDLKGANRTVVVSEADRNLGDFCWLPDGRIIYSRQETSQYCGCARAPASLCVVLEASPDDKLLTLSAFDPLKGRGKVLTTIAKDSSRYYACALSPDGSTFALSKTGEAKIHIRLLPLSGGSESDITVKGWPNLAGYLEWSPDGKGLYLNSVSPQTGTLLYVDLKGNAKPLWQKKGQMFGGWSIPSPDGRYLAIMGTVYNSNVWMLEGF